MQGLSVGMALVACGNHGQNGILDLGPLLDELDRLQAKVRFLRPNLPPIETAEEWFEWLADRRCDELWLAVDPCPRDLETVIRYGVGACPVWAIYTFGLDTSLIWHASERLSGDELVIELSETIDTGAGWDTDEEPETVLQELQEALAEAQMLAEERGEDEWSERFMTALAVLENATVPFIRIFPDGYGDDRQRRLLEGATLAYVFGRGGWCEWEGTPTPERRELARTALNLYVASVNALQCAING